MTPATLFKFLIAVLLVTCLVACVRNPAMPEAEDGARLFQANCAACHGSDGTGGTDAPDLTKIALADDGSFPRARVLSQIDGYGRGKLPEEAMPEFGALLAGDLVPVEVDGTLTPTPRALAALLFYLESLQTP